MGSVAKAAETDHDMISKLPPDIIEHIFSFLPTVDAVRASTLSKTYAKVWKDLTTLNFNTEGDFWEDGDVEARATFISRVLLFRSASDIHTFRLKLSSSQSYLPIIGDCIRAAVRHSVKQLDLHLSFYDLDLPPCIFWCKSLEVLKLSMLYWGVTSIKSESTWFPCLKFLQLRVDLPDMQELKKFLAFFPVLETMILDGPLDGYGHDRFADPDNSQIFSLQVSAPKLKTLVLSLVSRFQPVDIYVLAPKLETIDLVELGLTTCSLDESAKSLISASITFLEQTEIEGFFNSSSTTVDLLSRVSDVRTLSISAHYWQDLLLPEDWLPPLFHNVIQLRLAIGDLSRWELLAIFLNSAPSLEVLVLEYRPEGHTEFAELHWNAPSNVPTCLTSHLKTISVKGLKGLPVEMEILGYLLKNGHLLNKVLIFTSLRLVLQEHEELRGEVLRFDKATTCHLEFMQMEV